MTDLLAIRENDVVRDISPNDGMLDTLYGEDGYHFCGRTALACVDLSLRAAGKSPADVDRILDLPSGYGRVLRYLRAAFPRAEITACDLLRDGVDFCARTFGATPVYSCEDPAEIPLKPASFDLIWVGSLLTHLDAKRWASFLALFRSLLRPRGILIFTTHGRDAYHRMIDGSMDYGIPDPHRTTLLYRYERTGFGYADYPGSEGHYGISISDPAWVFKQVALMSEMRLVCFSERAWANFHDIFACVREADWQVDHRPVSASTLVKHKLRQVLRPRSFWTKVAAGWGRFRTRVHRAFVQRNWTKHFAFLDFTDDRALRPERHRGDEMTRRFVHLKLA